MSLKKTLELEPKHSDSLYNIGLLYCRLGELANGAHYLKRFLQIEKDETVEGLITYIEERLSSRHGMYDTKMLAYPTRRMS